VAPVQAHLVVQHSLALLLELVSGVGNPPIALHEHGRTKVLVRVPPVGRARGAAASAQNALVQAVELLAVRNALEVLPASDGRVLALQVGLDRLVLLVEEGEIGHQVLDDVGVRQRVDLGRLGGVGVDAAFCSSNHATVSPRPPAAAAACGRYIHKQAKVLDPPMFMAQLPQIPSLQDRRNVRVGSVSFLIRMIASNTMGPVWFRSSSYSCMYGFFSGVSGFHR
jgi:hypothetical protein